MAKPQSHAFAIATREAEKVSNGCICLLWLLLQRLANGGLRTTEIYCRTVLEATSPKLRCQHGHAPSDGAREGSVPGLAPSFQSPRVSLGCLLPFTHTVAFRYRRPKHRDKKLENTRDAITLRIPGAKRLSFAFKVLLDLAPSFFLLLLPRPEIFPGLLYRTTYHFLNVNKKFLKYKKLYIINVYN